MGVVLLNINHENMTDISNWRINLSTLSDRNITSTSMGLQSMQIGKKSTDKATDKDGSTLKPPHQQAEHNEEHAALHIDKKDDTKRQEKPVSSRSSKSMENDGERTPNAAVRIADSDTKSKLDENSEKSHQSNNAMPSAANIDASDGSNKKARFNRNRKNTDGTEPSKSAVMMAIESQKAKIAQRRERKRHDDAVRAVEREKKRRAAEPKHDPFPDTPDDTTKPYQQQYNGNSGYSDNDIASTFAGRKQFGDKMYSAKAARKAAYGEFGGTLDLTKAEFERQGHAGSKIIAVISVFLGIIRLAFRLIVILFRSIWRAIVYMAVAAAGIGLVAVIGLAFLFTTSLGELPSLKDYTLIAAPQDSTMYDADGQVIGVISTSSREPVSFGSIDQKLKDSTVSIEDERFYNHEGVDFYGIARALKANFDSWRSGGSSTSQGASTITQQYVRNAYNEVGTEQTVSRKLTEMILSAELESSMSKDDILNSYLNTVYYGNGNYGVEAASKYYFGHSAKNLTYYEAAILASIVNAPTIYNPATEEGRKNTAERANLVLDKMFSLGKTGDMTKEQLQEIKRTDINSVIHITEKQRVINQPFYYDYVMSELKTKYSEEEIKGGGWQIYTTLSIKDGKAAEKLVKSVEQRYGSRGVTSAIVDIDNATGAINSFCGGTDYNASQFNVATQGTLQQGSTLKPFMYATLMEDQGYYTTDKISTDPVNVAADGEKAHVITSYIGGHSATIERGIVMSDNAMAIHGAEQAGMSNINNMIHKCGIKGDLEDNTIAIIGGQTVGFSPLDMANAYRTIANKGQETDRWCVKSITDSYGNAIYKHKSKKTYAMSSEVALQLTDAMTKAVDQRTDWYNIPFDKQGWTIAAKTGTTDDKTDLWCSGFDTTRTVVVWIGGRDAKVEVPTTTPTACKEFSDYMTAVGQNDPKEEFEKPQFKTEIPKIGKNQSIEDYIALVQAKRLNPKVEYVGDTDKKEDTVIGVKDAGQLVDRGSDVSIEVARDKVVVPDFTKIDPSDVYKRSDGLDVTYDVKYVESGSSAPAITQQSIAASTVVTKGTSITLTLEILAPATGTDKTTEQVPVRDTDGAMTLLSRERDAYKKKSDSLQSQLDSLHQQTDTQTTNQATVPSLRGVTISQARTILSSLGFNVRYDGSSSDTVAYTSPSGGSVVTAGSSVTLYSNTPSSSYGNKNKNNNGNSSSSSSSSSSSRDQDD